MLKHTALGVHGEKIAANYLRAKGYTIVAQNWRYKRLELDLIVEKRGHLTFVEVKTRRRRVFGFPEGAVTLIKQQHMIEAAGAYMYATSYEQEYRFDIVAIILEPVVEVRHFVDAFFPTWE